MRRRRPVWSAAAVLGAGLGAVVAGCGSASAPALTLIAYDSFPVKDTTLNAALEAFTAKTGIEVEVAIAGDAGVMVSKAVLTAGNPEGDVMWGIDNTLLSRALDAEVFAPYQSKEITSIAASLVALTAANQVTPVDFGDVCVNYDIAWFDEHELAPPSDLADLTKPEYRDLLVVEDPASSSPGLAFLLATIVEFGGSGWQRFWADLRANGVEVVDSWTTAYYDRFSGSAGAGPRPLVVSYASSPPAEVILADPPRTHAATAAVTATCFRQVEFAGVLRGSKRQADAQHLLDFLVSEQFQSEIALNLFVWPARTDVDLPDEFVDFVDIADNPLEMSPAEIDAGREAWIDEWTELVIR